MDLRRMLQPSLRGKLILLYFLTIFIPLLVTGQILLSVSGKKIIEQTTNITRDNALQTARSVQTTLGGYVDIVNRLSVDQTLNNYLNPQRIYASELDSIDAYDLYLKPVTYYDFNYKNPFAQLRIEFANTTLLQDSNIFFYADEDIRARPEFLSASRAEGKTVWGWIREEDKIYVARSIYNNAKQLTAVISMLIPSDVLRAIVSESDESDRTNVIADPSGYVFSATKDELMGTSISGKGFFEPEAAQPFDYHEEGVAYKVVVSRLGDGKQFPDWRLYTLIPINRLIDDKRRISQISLWVMTGGLAVSCGIFLLALGRITERVKLLVKKMQTVKKGELSTIEDSGARDEIGVLTRNFNEMIDNLQRSVFENYEVNLKLKDITIKKQEAELYALQNQINPHFLFNTLESIRMDLHHKGDQETSGVVMNFSRLFRHLLNWQGEFVTLREEIDLVDKYLAIQKYRFGDRLTYELDIEPDISEALLPKLTIQPLVENAVKHGIESVRGGGRIRVAANRADNGSILIEIEDDGIGIPQPRLKELLAELERREMKKSGSIGLKNVHDRIQLHYGREWGLSIVSPVAGGEGTLVNVRLPDASRPREGGEDDV